MSIQELAIAAEERHAAVLEQLAHGWSRVAGEEMVIGIRHDFTCAALPQLGVSFPHQLSATNGDQAIAKAVIADLIDTETRLRSLAQNATLQKQALKIMQTGIADTVVDAINAPGGFGDTLKWIVFAVAAFAVLYIVIGRKQS